MCKSSARTYIHTCKILPRVPGDRGGLGLRPLGFLVCRGSGLWRVFERFRRVKGSGGFRISLKLEVSTSLLNPKPY